MAFFRFPALLFVGLLGVALVTPSEAQTSATLNVSARVVEECTISTRIKRKLVKLARQLGDPSILRRCSKGVVSRVDQQVVPSADLQPPAVRPVSLTRKRVVRKRGADGAEVVLVTVSY